LAWATDVLVPGFIGGKPADFVTPISSARLVGATGHRDWS